MTLDKFISESGFLICKRHLPVKVLALEIRKMCSLSVPSHPCFAWFLTQCIILCCRTVYEVGGITSSILRMRKLRSCRKWCCWDSTPVLSDSGPNLSLCAKLPVCLEMLETAVSLGCQYTCFSLYRVGQMQVYSCM